MAERMVRNNNVFCGFHLAGAKHTIFACCLFAGFCTGWTRRFAGLLI
jgi:hypothetical protein